MFDNKILFLSIVENTVVDTSANLVFFHFVIRVAQIITKIDKQIIQYVMDKAIKAWVIALIVKDKTSPGISGLASYHSVYTIWI